MLNCCILLSKVDNIQDSLKYAKQAREIYEKELDIVKGKSVPNFESAGSTKEEREEIHKKLTNYAIALHMIAKGFKSLNKTQEGREFLKKALKVVEEYHPIPNRKLIDTIKDDINDFNSDIRSLSNKKKVEDPDTLLEKLTTLPINQKRPVRSSISSRSQKDRSMNSSEKRMHSTSSERKDMSNSKKPPLASKRSILSRK